MLALKLADHEILSKRVAARTPGGHAMNHVLIVDDDADSAATMRELVGDRKSTRLNSSHLVISYAVFCLKKKNVLQAHGRDRVRRQVRRLRRHWSPRRRHRPRRRLPHLKDAALNEPLLPRLHNREPPYR